MLQGLNWLNRRRHACRWGIAQPIQELVLVAGQQCTEAIIPDHLRRLFPRPFVAIRSQPLQVCGIARKWSEESAKSRTHREGVMHEWIAEQPATRVVGSVAKLPACQ